MRCGTTFRNLVRNMALCHNYLYEKLNCKSFSRIMDCMTIFQVVIDMRDTEMYKKESTNIGNIFE